ncbi:MAG: hypothetical protein HY392_04825 [Candidatus Diapherotrites archaeon]|nr:hypothetical protein [Candidatus Diapherotrites archaeon]
MKPAIDSIKQKTEQNLGESFEDSLLTQTGKQQKQEALKLKNFMKTYPMLEERLSNELVAHTIAFGIGKEWLKKLGGKNALLAQWIEKIESRGDTIARFMDMNTYFKEFQE